MCLVLKELSDTQGAVIIMLRQEGYVFGRVFCLSISRIT